MTKMIFVNLPVSDVARSTAFYEAIGPGARDLRLGLLTASWPACSKTSKWETFP